MGECWLRKRIGEQLLAIPASSWYAREPGEGRMRIIVTRMRSKQPLPSFVANWGLSISSDKPTKLLEDRREMLKETKSSG